MKDRIIIFALLAGVFCGWAFGVFSLVDEVDRAETNFAKVPDEIEVLVAAVEFKAEPIEVLERLVNFPSMKHVIDSAGAIKPLSVPELTLLVDELLQSEAVNSRGESMAFLMLVFAIVEHDMDAGLKLAVKVADRVEDEGIVAIYRLLIKKDPDRVLEIIKDGSFSYEQYVILFNHLDLEGLATVKLKIDAWPSEYSRAGAWDAYYTCMIRLDAKAALEEVLAMPNGKERENILKDFSEKLFRWDFDKAVKLMDQIPDGRTRLELMADAISEAVDFNPKKSAELMLQLKHELAEDYLEFAIKNVAKKDIQLAAEMVLQIPYGDNFDYSVRYLIDEWSAQDPDKALEWVLTHLIGSPRENYLGEIYSEMLQKSPHKLMNQLDLMESGALRDSLFKETINYQAKYGNTKDALEWAREIVNGEERNTAITKIMEQWVGRDPVSVVEYHRETNYEGIASSDEISSIALSLAKMDLRASADWALSLPREEWQYAAVQSFTGNWVISDPMEPTFRT